MGVPAPIPMPIPMPIPGIGLRLAAVGVSILVTTVWVMGWGFLWYKAPDLTQHQIEPEQRLVGVPSGALLKLKLVTVRQHCFHRAACRLHVHVS